VGHATEGTGTAATRRVDERVDLNFVESSIVLDLFQFNY
jgi:hypothetical protein